MVAAEAIAEKRAGKLAEGEYRTLTSGDGHGLAGADLFGYGFLVTAEAGENQPSERDSTRTGHIGDRVGLFKQCRRTFEVALEGTQYREVVERNWQHSEHTSFTG